jgi:hypothetical protein
VARLELAIPYGLLFPKQTLYQLSYTLFFFQNLPAACEPDFTRFQLGRLNPPYPSIVLAACLD